MVVCQLQGAQARYRYLTCARARAYRLVWKLQNCMNGRLRPGLSPRAYPIRILDPDTVPLVLACALAALPLALALPLPLTKRRVLARNLARDVDEKLCVTENLLCS